MEEAESPKRMKTHLCIPRLRGNIRNNTGWLSPMTLVERFREAVFRLMVLSALSKATTNSSHNNNNVRSADVMKRSYNYRPGPREPHHSEAVADCIEFIKKTALMTEEDRDAASSSIDATTDMVMPVSVMSD